MATMPSALGKSLYTMPENKRCFNGSLARRKPTLITIKKSLEMNAFFKWMILNLGIPVEDNFNLFLQGEMVRLIFSLCNAQGSNIIKDFPVISG